MATTRSTVSGPLKPTPPAASCAYGSRRAPAAYFAHDATGDLASTHESHASHEWDGLHITHEHDGSGTLLRRYTHGHTPTEGVSSLIDVKDAQANHYFYHFDQVGGVRNLTDRWQNPIKTYELSPFGGILQDGGNAANRFRFPGTYITLAQATHLRLSPSRLYCSSLGRFLSRDPFAWGPGAPSIPMPAIDEVARLLKGSPARLDRILKQLVPQLDPDVPLPTAQQLQSPFGHMSRRELRAFLRGLAFDHAYMGACLRAAYAYAESNPVTVVDPTGGVSLVVIVRVIIIIGIILLLASRYWMHGRARALTSDERERVRRLNSNIIDTAGRVNFEFEYEPENVNGSVVIKNLNAMYVWGKFVQRGDSVTAISGWGGSLTTLRANFFADEGYDPHVARKARYHTLLHESYRAGYNYFPADQARPANYAQGVLHCLWPILKDMPEKE